MGNQYSYEDHPDGTHCLQKTACLTKSTSLIGLFLASLDVINFSKPANLGAALARFPQYVVPGVLSGVTFGLTACTLTMLRQKDDNWNYFFAGGAMGSVFGIARRSFVVGTPCTVLFALAGVSYKEYRQSEIATRPHYKNWNGQWDSMQHDYTLTPERPKYTPDRPSFV